MTATKPLPDEVDMLIKALDRGNPDPSDYVVARHFFDAYDRHHKALSKIKLLLATIPSLRSHIAAQAERIALLEGATKADEQRLQDAGNRVDINAGCDTPEMMADRILELEARLKVFDELAAQQCQYDENGLWVALVKKSVSLQEQNTVLEADNERLREAAEMAREMLNNMAFNLAVETLEAALAQTGEK